MARGKVLSKKTTDGYSNVCKIQIKKICNKEKIIE